MIKCGSSSCGLVVILSGAEPQRARDSGKTAQVTGREADGDYYTVLRSDLGRGAAAVMRVNSGRTDESGCR